MTPVMQEPVQGSQPSSTRAVAYSLISYYFPSVKEEVPAMSI